MSTIERALGHSPTVFYCPSIFHVGRKTVSVRRMKPLNSLDCREKPLYVASVVGPNDMLFGGYDETPIGSVIVALTAAGFNIKR